MGLLQWHNVCKIGGDELHRPPVVALRLVEPAVVFHIRGFDGIFLFISNISLHFLSLATSQGLPLHFGVRICGGKVSFPHYMRASNLHRWCFNCSRTPLCGLPTFVGTTSLWTLFARPICFPYIIPLVCYCICATPSFTRVDTSLLWTLFIQPSGVHIQCDWVIDCRYNNPMSSGRALEVQYLKWTSFELQSHFHKCALNLHLIHTSLPLPIRLRSGLEVTHFKCTSNSWAVVIRSIGEV